MDLSIHFPAQAPMAIAIKQDDVAHRYDTWQKGNGKASNASPGRFDTEMRGANKGSEYHGHQVIPSFGTFGSDWLVSAVWSL